MQLLSTNLYAHQTVSIELSVSVSLDRAEGKSAGHVRREIQTFQRHQVHDEGRQVPGADIKRAAPPQPDRTTMRTRADRLGELVPIPSVYSFQDLPTNTGSSL